MVSEPYPEVVCDTWIHFSWPMILVLTTNELFMGFFVVILFIYKYLLKKLERESSFVNCNCIYILVGYGITQCQQNEIIALLLYSKHLTRPQDII